MLPSWAQNKMQILKHWRDKSAAAGHNTARISIGYFDGLLLAADDTGAYHFRFGPRGNITFSSVGHPSVALESIVYGRA